MPPRLCRGRPGVRFAPVCRPVEIAYLPRSIRRKDGGQVAGSDRRRRVRASQRRRTMACVKQLLWRWGRAKHLHAWINGGTASPSSPRIPSPSSVPGVRSTPSPCGRAPPCRDQSWLGRWMLQTCDSSANFHEGHPWGARSKAGQNIYHLWHFEPDLRAHVIPGSGEALIIDHVCGGEPPVPVYQHSPQGMAWMKTDGRPGVQPSHIHG